MKFLNVLVLFVLFFSFESVAQSRFIKSEIKTTSYTVPAGKIAKVTPFSGDVALDGVTVGAQRDYSLGAGGNFAFNLMSGYHCLTITIAGNTPTYTLYHSNFWGPVSASANGAPAVISTTTGAGTYTFCQTGAGFFLNVGALASFSGTLTAKSNSGKSFYAKSGSVLTGTRYLIEIYER